MATDFLTLRASDITKLRPRYIGGALLNQRLNWTAEDRAAVTTLCGASADLEQISPILARHPQTIVHKASDMGLQLPKTWSRLIRKAYAPHPREPQVVLEYPYITTDKNDDTALLIAINSVVPRGLPGNLREDVCQDILVAILEGELPPEDFNIAVPKFLKAARKRYSMPWGTLSLDQPLWDDSTRTLGETISDNPLYQ